MPCSQNMYRGLVLAVVLPLVYLQVGYCAQSNIEGKDTVRLGIHEADTLFLQRNLLLLAARFSIDAAQAAVVQAGLWSNPNLSVEQNVYNQFTHRYFDVTRSGNTDIALQQLILLGGKRGKQVQLAEINSGMSILAFDDLLRSLKFQLRTCMYDLYYLRQSLRFYDESIQPLRKTLDAATHAYEKRAILLSEMLRLKALVLTLETERLDVRTRIADLEGTLHTLLHDTTGAATVYLPEVNTDEFDRVRVDTLSLDYAVRTALEHRPDVKIAQANVESEEANLSLQRAMAIPDVTVGGHWSQNGSYIPNYYALTLSIDLPFFNRNQGNIDVSERALAAQRARLESVGESVRREVRSAYEKAVAISRLGASRDRNMPGEYRTLVNGMIANYQNRNMTVIEFTDFFESYRASMIQLIQLENNRLDALEELNYAAGAPLW